MSRLFGVLCALGLFVFALVPCVVAEDAPAAGSLAAPPAPPTVTVPVARPVGWTTSSASYSPCDPCGRDPYDPCRLSGWTGVFFAALPGWGLGVSGGVWLREDSCLKWGAEVSLDYQDLYHEEFDEYQTGKFMGARLGVKVLTNPTGRFHWTGRAGLQWIQVGGEPRKLSVAEIPNDDDYFGAYAAVGAEFDINRWLSTGPEIGVFAGIGLQGEWAFVPEARWHLIVNF